MSTGKERRRTPLTADQQADAARLHAIWTKWRGERRAQKEDASQEWIGAQFVDPITQGAVTQYINGSIGLNTTTVAEFARLFGVSPSDISPSLGEIIQRSTASVSESSNKLLAQLSNKGSPDLTAGASPATKTHPGVVLSWDEVTRMIRDDLLSRLPEVFSLEIPDEALRGYANQGDVVTLNRGLRDVAKAGDGILVHSKGPGAPFIAIRIYKPKGDGSFSAVPGNPNFETLHSVNDQLEIIAVITGVPSCRWSNR
jgi:hypothetical protein